MTTPASTLPDSEIPIPLFPQKSTSLRLAHFDSDVYRTDESSHIYKLTDGLCGDGGAGDLKKQLLGSRLLGSLDSTDFTDLDTLFGGAFGLTRFDFETYPYDVDNGMLTSDQWDEVRIKDSWFRQRCQSMLMAFQLGGTPEGFRMVLQAVTGLDCDLFEIWKYIDNYAITTPMGRLSQLIRNEVVIKPHLASMDQKTKRLILLSIDRIKPVDCVVTVDVNGLAVHTPITPNSVSSDSTYFEIQKTVTGVPDLAKLPKPEVLANDVLLSENWMKPGVAVTAPTAAYNVTQEHSYYYLYSKTSASAIDTVVYQSDPGTGKRKIEQKYQSSVSLSSGYGPWIEFTIADSPDNYPGGKSGLTPGTAPAVSPGGSVYHFPYKSQADYVSQMSAIVLAGGGQVNGPTYRYPDSTVVNVEKTWSAEYAFPVELPTKVSTVTSPFRSGVIPQKSLVNAGNLPAQNQTA